MTTMTNTELLHARPDLLTGVDRQRQFLLRLWSQQQPCPNCGTLLNVFEAARRKIDEIDTLSGAELKYRCTACERELQHVVPLVSIGLPWEWRLVHEAGIQRRGIYTIWPEKRWIGAFGIFQMASDAVANGQIAPFPPETTPAQAGRLLHEAGLITIGEPPDEDR